MKNKTFNEKFIKEVLDAEKRVKQGKVIKFKNVEEMTIYFEGL